MADCRKLPIFDVGVVAENWVLAFSLGGVEFLEVPTTWEEEE